MAMNDKQDVQKLLLQGQTVQFSTTGYSMYPFLNPDKKDQVIVAPLPKRRLRRGDVVLYRRDGEKGSTDAEGFAEGILVLHRIHHVKGDAYYMVGDNQNQVEGPLRADQIKGLMVARVRKGRTMSASNFLYALSVHAWLLVCPIRPGIMGAAKVIKDCLIR